MNKKAVQKVIARTDYVALSHKQNVVFVPEVEYGDRLLVAQETRLHSKLGIHLPNTLRKRSNTDFEEKMVDTALSADVVAAAYSVNSSWILVVSEDDDIIPPLFVAESALFGYNSKVKLLRKRDCMQMQHLNDILVKG